jgi:cell division inhibitor SepF
MAFRDSWHRALVYFGLAEERPYVDEFELERQRHREAEIARERDRERAERMRPAVEPEAEMEDRYRDRPNVRRLSSRRRQRDDFDDIFADDEPRAGSRATTALRPVERARNGGDVRVHLVIPKSFNDAQQVADKFKQSIPVVLNLQSTDNDLAKRLIDFASGLTYALDGGMQRIAHKVFMLTPRNVQISAEEKAELIEKGFFNQS